MKQRLNHCSHQMKAGPCLPDGPCSPLRRQRGITLILVLVLLVITAAASIFFHNSMVGSTRLSGANRDYTASQLLAESAMETLRGRFVTNLVSTSSCNKIAYGQGEGPVYSIDHCDAYELVQGGGWWDNTTGPGQVVDVMAKVPFVFSAVDGTTEWDIQKTPNILQWVANGEANNGNSVPVDAPSWHGVPAATTSMRIDDLFKPDDGFSPFLFKLNENGLLIPSEEVRWTDEVAQEKAAAWLQVTRHCDPKIKDDCESEFDEHTLDFWVQAVGQVGFARSYLQRYVGTFYPPTQLGGLAALLESSNIDRRVKP